MASKRRLRRKACTKKATHVTADGAKVALALAKRKHPGEDLHFYKCQFCSRYHVGHKMKKRRLGIAT